MDISYTYGNVGSEVSPSVVDCPEPRRQSHRSILIGSETLLVHCAGILQQNGHEIVAVVAEPGPVADWARGKNFPCFRKAGDLLHAGLGMADYIFSITNLAVLSPEVLALASRAAINFHDGPLPAYAGLNTPVWALLEGERQHGVTWHLMTETIDGGDVLASEPVAIDAGESAVSLNIKCFEAALRSFAALAGDLDGAMARRSPQPGPARRLFGRADRPKGAATIDWRAPAEAIARLVSALDFGGYRNPLGMSKALLETRLLLVGQVEVLDSRSGLPPGTVVEGGNAPVVATGTNDLRLLSLLDPDGQALAGPFVEAGARFSSLDDEQQARLSVLDGAAGRYETWWLRRLLARDCLQLPQFLPSERSAGQRIVEDRTLPPGHRGNALLAAFVGYLGRVADRESFDIGYADPFYFARLKDVGGWFAGQLPLHVELGWDRPLAAIQNDLDREISALHRRVAIARDLPARSPELRDGLGLGHPMTVQIVDRLDEMAVHDETVLHVAITADGSTCRWSYDPSRLPAGAAEDLWLGYCTMVRSAEAAPDKALAALDLLSGDERQRVLRDWNATQMAGPSAEGIHVMFAKQAARAPHHIAVTARGVSLTYAELDARSNRLAHHLRGMGVGADVLVGVNLERSVEMVVSLIAIHKAGGAYVPLDPAYPPDRLKHMIEDSGMALIVTQSSLARDLPATGARLLCIDEMREEVDAQPSAPLTGPAEASNLAYVIYTSGSTGLPKGVMVEHRNVLNFFAGMDQKLEPQGVWLAVTSLNFDISVLEIFWPLTRGYRVVVATEREVRGDVPERPSQRPLDFSLFYFASSDSASNAEQYRLLLEGARFGDANGFEAVWTPERHFHAFGGPYPNPSVASAAIAAVTSRIRIRAGSVVATLHHPIRIAEEWALVDNLSNGRVGIAFASGWQPDDFVLNPANYADRTGALMRTLDEVRGLWRGEERSFPGPLGHDVAVRTYPRPVQPELPCWITSAGNAATFEQAGRAGTFVLTHLLGQSADELAGKIAAYRRAWREAGHAGEGHVTLMLHTFVGEDADMVRTTVRGPLIEYLRTSTSLLRQYAWSFPAFRRPRGSEPSEQLDLADLTADEIDALLEHAFERYFETSGLFGTVEDCFPLLRRLGEIGVDEIGCLIDFGVEPETVLQHLPALGRLRMEINARSEEQEYALPELIARYGVTHLQCTPSLLQMLASDPAGRPALASLHRLMVGGEAFPPHLAQDMTALLGGTVMNMYGPTETTIWSAVHALTPGEQTPPPLGRPLANQQIYILDRRLGLVRPGTPGELVIGGDGVVRGYLNRPELTAERFVQDPFDLRGRVYRTGDLARQRADGTLEFLGRLDHQVKIRGYRIELGEIEAILAEHPLVDEAVVTAQGGAGDARLVAYVAAGATVPPTEALREHLRSKLPDFMIPATFINLGALPRTPNGKIDRARLPSPDLHAIEAPASHYVEPAGELESQIQAIWCDALKLPRVGINDNFFDLGGHSLLAVQVHRRLAAITDRPLSLTDIFRFPTIATLGAHLAGAPGQADAAAEAQDRARSRRDALQRRGLARATMRN